MEAWRELAVPHRDVLKGTFKQSEFAADLTQVVRGTAAKEYLHAQEFYRRTFITEGMSLLLRSVVQRVLGKGGDPVIQLQTAFGGGKTHAMLAVYHLARSTVPHHKLHGLGELLDDMGVSELPRAKVAVIDGNDLSPNEGKKRNGATINTLWGELAWQLGKDKSYEIVALSDRSGVSPGKERLIELLQHNAPCIVLMDELVAYIRQFAGEKSYRGGTFESNMSFVQALTEACKAVPNAVLLASLPESEMEAAGERGKEALAALEKYFGRVEAVWKPVGTEEAFSIVKRRLFDDLQPQQAEIKEACTKIHRFYTRNKDLFPSEVKDQSYLERLNSCYPLHPEIFDRLYEDWSTLHNFQRTRGVLQFLAIVIHKLWQSDNNEPLIMPGSIPFADPEVRTQITRYLPAGWEPVIERDIDSKHARAVDVDNKDARFGKVHAACRTARTIFLGSAPNANIHTQQQRGLPREHVLLGACTPSHTIANYEDALKRLEDSLHHLSVDTQGYRFDTKANLRREMESRRQRLNEQEDVLPAVEKELKKLIKGKSFFGGVHVFCKHDDIPDDHQLRLVAPTYNKHISYSKKGDNSELERQAQEFLQKRGNQLRQKRNRLLFFVVERSAIVRLKENASTWLAWQSIVDDINNGEINLDIYQKKEAEKNCTKEHQVFVQTIREAYCFLMNAYRPDDSSDLEWEYEKIDISKAHLMSTVCDKIIEREWVLKEWAANYLHDILKKYYFKNDNDILITKIFDDLASYLYFYRLENEDVLRQTIEKGVVGGDFGYARNKDGDRYDRLSIGTPTHVIIDEHTMLVKADIAKQQQSTPAQQQPTTTSTRQAASTSKQPAQKRRFHASVKVHPTMAKMELNNITEEVLAHLVEDSSCSLEIILDVHAQHRDGFSNDVQRTLRENCRNLNFNNAEFEED